VDVVAESVQFLGGRDSGSREQQTGVVDDQESIPF
jgi:hypothetical protein